MKIRHPALLKFGALAAASIIRSWMSTLDYRMVCYDPTVDPFHPDYNGHKIMTLWHEYLLVPLVPRSHCNLALLVSQHLDAEILSGAAKHLGFECVRGSTNRGSIGALGELCTRSKRMSLVITPDGPRGPRRHFAAGPVFLASRLGLPLVMMGVGLDRPWRFNSWDRFAIARPGGRARGVIGPPMQIPPDLDRTGIEHYRQEAERMLNRLTLEAEAWAEAGTDKLGSIPVRRDYHASVMQRRRIDSGHAASTLLGPHFLQRANHKVG